MKKIFKVLFSTIIISLVTFITIKIIAEEKPIVVDMIQNYEASYVLYSNGELYVWGKDIKIKRENVTKIVKRDEGINYLDNEGNLKELSVYYSIPDTITNVKDMSEKYYLTNNNELYSYYYDVGENQFVTKLLFTNVVSWKINSSGSLAILDTNDSLYGYGSNIFGRKINEGENINDAPILIATNVKDYSININNTNYNTEANDYGNYYITNDNTLYIMSSTLAYPLKYKDNVTSYLYNHYYISNGKTYFINLNIENGKIITTDEKLLFEEELIQANYGSMYYYNNVLLLTNEFNLYVVNNDDDITLFDTNVKQLLNNEELYLKKVV